MIAAMTVSRSRFFSTTVEPPDVIPPPNISDKPPPRPACSKMNSTRTSAAMMWMVTIAAVTQSLRSGSRPQILPSALRGGGTLGHCNHIAVGSPRGHIGAGAKPCTRCDNEKSSAVQISGTSAPVETTIASAAAHAGAAFAAGALDADDSARATALALRCAYPFLV